MDTYSYISENGTVRQIEDLIAKAKNEEQDAGIAENRTAINALSGRVGAMEGKFPLVVMEEVDIGFSGNINAGQVNKWEIERSKSGYFPVSYVLQYPLTPYVTIGAEGVTCESEHLKLDGFFRSTESISNYQVLVRSVWLKLT